MLFVVNVFAMHEQQMLAGDFLCTYNNILGWTEDESTSVPDAASEVSNCPG